MASQVLANITAKVISVINNPPPIDNGTLICYIVLNIMAFVPIYFSSYLALGKPANKVLFV
jgi:hypothetical protein